MCKSFINSNNKALSTVVAVSLLLLVSITVFISFSSWTNNFTSNLQADVDIKKDESLNKKIEIGDFSKTKLFVKKSDDIINYKIKKITLGGFLCQENLELNSIKNMEKIDLSICIKKIFDNNLEKKQKLIIETDSGIYKKSIYLEDIDNEELIENSREVLIKNKDSLVGYWNFNDKTAHDLSGNNNNGEFFGNVKIKNKEAVFSGGGIKINHSDSLILKDNFTILITSTIYEKPKNSCFILFHKYFSGDDVGSLACFRDDLKYTFDGRNKNHIYLLTRTNNQYKINEKHYLAFVKNEDSWRIYFNGELETENKISSGNDINSLQNLYFGSRGTTDYNLNGSLDDIAIYNRVLTDLEIKELYTGVYFENYPKNCKEIKDINPNSISGFYKIMPNKNNGEIIDVFCDQKTDGGGWMLIGRTGESNTVIDNFGWMYDSGELKNSSLHYSLNLYKHNISFTEILYGQRKSPKNNEWGSNVFKRINFNKNFIEENKDKMSTGHQGFKIKGNYPSASGMQGAFGFTNQTNRFYMRDCCGFALHGMYSNKIISGYCDRSDGPLKYYSGEFCENNWGNRTYKAMIMVR